MPESVEAAWEEFWRLHDWGEDGGEAIVNVAVRADERNRLLNPSDELVEVVAEAIGDTFIRTRYWPTTREMAHAALQAAGSALDSGSAG